MGVGIGRPAVRRVVALFQLGGVVLLQQGLGLRLGRHVLVIGGGVGFFVHQHVDVSRSGQFVHGLLLGGGVIVGGCAVFIQRVQQRLSVLQRFGVGRPGQGGAVVGTDRVAPRVQRVVFTMPTPFGVQRLIQRRGVHAGRGDQVVDGGLQSGNGIVHLFLTGGSRQHSLCLCQCRLIVGPKTVFTDSLTIPAIISGMETGSRRIFDGCLERLCCKSILF